VTVSTPTVAPETPVSGAAPAVEPALFFLGTHLPHWLWRGDVAVPLFVSDRRLRRYRTLHRAATTWAVDSGGFTELQTYGRWTITPVEYVRRLRRYRDEIGAMAWAAPQDWMCEPAIIRGGHYGGQSFAGTGLTVAEHQRRTVANYLTLRDLAPELPIVPVLQGWTLPDYLRCVDLYASAGVDLTTAGLVGVGSLCRRQSATEVGDILTALHRVGLTRLHGFGVKTGGLARYGHLLTSADSMAWSTQARHRPPLPGCLHRSCANCARYALTWRRRVLAAAARPAQQLPLFGLAWSEPAA
jgi:hypothetical protein